MTSAPGLSQTKDLRRQALRVLFWFLAMSLLFNLMFGEMGIIQGIRQRWTVSRLEGEVAELQAANQALADDIEQLRHDPYRIETIARQELGLCRPGELLFLFPPDDPPSDPPP